MSNTDNYENKTFKYNYPYSWEQRNRIYLKKYEDRPIIRDYIVPLVYRIRFYDGDSILSDNFYVGLNSNISFPIEEEDTLIEWYFKYDNELAYVTSDNYKLLKTAIADGYDNITLFKSYSNA